jgi:hypothetical protein
MSRGNEYTGARFVVDVVLSLLVTGITAVLSLPEVFNWGLPVWACFVIGFGLVFLGEFFIVRAGSGSGGGSSWDWEL